MHFISIHIRFKVRTRAKKKLNHSTTELSNDRSVRRLFYKKINKLIILKVSKKRRDECGAVRSANEQR